MSPLSKLLRAAVLLALVFGPRLAEAQKALVYCPVAIDATGCATIKTALTSAYPGGVETGFDGTQGTVDLKTVDLFQYSVVVVPSLADDSLAPYALLRDATVASKLRAALLGRRAFWSGTPDQGVVSTTRPQKDALIQNLAAWASGDFATVNAPGLAVLQDNSTDVTTRYDWVQAIAGFALVADTRLASYSAVSSLTTAGNAVLASNGSTLAYANMASMGFQTPSGAPGTSIDAVGKTGTGVGGQVVLITQSGANTGGAVVRTDKDDYAPGTPVVITGTGFGAGESVSLMLHEDPTIEPDFSFTATADQNGAFTFTGFTPDTLDVDVRFVLTATGQTSGRRAQTTFTDGNVTAVANTATRNATGASNTTVACAAGTPGTFVLNAVYCGQTQVSSIQGGGTTQIFLRWLNPSSTVVCSADINNVVVGTTYSLNCQLNAAGTWVFRACTNQNCTGSGGILGSVNAVVVGAQNQTIAFSSTAPANAIYGDTYTPTATATSGLGVVFTTSGACSFASGVVKMTGVGTCTVDANQAGDASWNPAPQVQQTFSVGQRAVTVTADPKTKVYGAVDPTLTYSLTSGSLVAGDGFSGAPARLAGTAVGSYAITQGSLTLGANYALTFVGASLTITPLAITVTADPQTKGYGDADPALTYTVTTGALVTGDAFTGSLTRAAGENIGSYAIQKGTLDAGGNYTLSFVGANLTITKRAVTVTADAQTKGYGDPDPALTYQITTGSLVGADQFSGALTRASGEGVGTYAITQGTLSLGGNYALTYAGANLTITARAITVTAAAKSKVYGDADPAFTYSVTTGSLINGDAFSGALSRVAGESAGTYAITQGTLAVNGNYTITYTGANLTITPKGISVTADPKTKVYGDADPALTYTVAPGSLVGSDQLTGTLSRAAGENVGNYAIQQGSVTGGGNYTITFVSKDLAITARALTITADPRTKVYGDADPALTYQLTSGSLVGSDQFSGSLSRAPGETVGSYAILQGSVTAGGNYAITYSSANLSITTRAVSVTADPQTKVYGDPDPAFTYKITSGSLAFSDAFSGALAGSGNQNVGPHPIVQGTLALNSNYVLTYVGDNLTITPRPITVTADGKTKVYGDNDPAFTAQVTTGNLVFSDQLSGALSRAAGENVGSYAITQGALTAGSNYDLNFVSGSLTITTRPVTITADTKSKVYGDADPTLTYQITSGSLAFSDVFAGSLARTAGENVGSYGILQGSVALSANYALSYVGANLTVTVRPIGITADPQTKVYGDADPALTYKITLGSLAFSDAFSGALTRAPGEGVGPYGILQGTVTAGGNYALSYTGANLSITPRPVTVTAVAQSKVYGDADPSLTYNVTVGNLVGSDAFSGGLSTATGSAATFGTHPIVQNDLTLGANYTITYIGALLTVSKRPITVTADPQTKVYGNPDPALTAKVTVGNLVYGDALSGSLTRAAGEDVNGYAIQQGGLTAGTNYMLTYVGANLSITPRSISVQPIAPDLIWTGAALTPSYSLQLTAGTFGFSDSYSSLGAGVFAPATVTNVGSYATSVSGLSNGNYAITPVAGTVNVLDKSKPSGAITELLPIPIGGTPLVKANFTDVTTGNSNIVAWHYRVDNAPYSAALIPVSPQSPNVNVQSTVVVPTGATDVVQVCVQGEDAGGNWSLESCALLAIYDPSAGFVTGGGWINSPAGAYTPDPTLTGKANFGFVSKYQKGANVPTGNTEFQFKEGNLNFSSTSFQWLVIQGTTMSQFKGVGTINGTGSYQFLVTAIDGDQFSGAKKPDSFRIKITNGSTVVYDNQIGADDTSAAATTLGGGSIQIQSK
jgi:hypothetical protein